MEGGSGETSGASIASASTVRQTIRDMARLRLLELPE